MGLVHSIITKQLHLIFYVLFPMKLEWEALVSFIDFITQPWRNLFWLCFNVYLTLWSGIGSLSMKMLVLPIQMLVLPIQIYNAIQKEDMMEMEMEMQEIQDLCMESEHRVTELEGELQGALDECKQYKDLLDAAETQIYNAKQKEDMMEMEMQEIQNLCMESEHRVTELEGELQGALDECKQHKDLLDAVETQKNAILEKYQLLESRVLELEDEKDLLRAEKERALKGVHEGEREVFQQKEVGNSLLLDGHKVGIDHNQHSVKHLTGKIHSHDVERWLVNGRPRHKGREAALSSSLFSVFLSLLVGAIAWQAEDPCIPLVIAVFMVVCMSLKAVAQFLLSIYNGPGFDALALLSFNWFILGTLAYPVLPRIAQTVAPIGAKFGQWLLRLMGVSYISEKLRTAFL